MNRKVVTLFAVLVVLLVGASGWHFYNQKAAVTIVFNLPSTSGLTVTLNNKDLSVSELSDTYYLRAGSYALHASQAGYNDFQATFTVKRSQAALINIDMQPTASGTLTAPQQLPALAGSVQGAQVKDVQYFYSNTWAFAKLVADDTDPAVLVAKYDAGSSSWSIVLGPGTFFQKSDLSGLPENVQLYLQQSGHVARGN